jgi:hypothetical protein
MMRPGAIALALSVLLAGCGLYREPAPSGEPVYLPTYEGSCASGWIEGSLRGTGEGVMDMDILDTLDWPEGVDRQRFVSVAWPSDFTGVRLAGGEVAVVDASGNLVARRAGNTGSRGR